MGKQITNRLLMVRPAHFGFNPETAASNVFQKEDPAQSPGSLHDKALNEFDTFVLKLREAGVFVDIIEDTPDPVKPDAIFPNNWISMHRDGAVITYPMYAPTRRMERRADILSFLEAQFDVRKNYAFDHYEDDGLFLEGTGSMVFDRAHKIVYACLSDRTDITLLDKFCVLRGYQKVVFRAYNHDVPIYHTNVVMALGQSFAVICLDCIPDANERQEVIRSCTDTGHEIIEISTTQMAHFAGNMLQVETRHGDSLIVMSRQALEALNPAQVMRLEKYGKILSSALDTIEASGGGSARCMMAENFLPARHVSGVKNPLQ